jgi:predicted phage terminase large subunit-like protein
MTSLSPDSRLLLEEALRRGLALPPETIAALTDGRDRLTFREFVDRVRPGYVWYRHCLALADVLQRVADGELSRVMVFMPPRDGKSELVSRLFAAYYLHRHRTRWVGVTSYGAELAYTLSRAARDHFAAAGGTIRGDAAAVKHWETPEGGGLWAAGVGGPITGKGFSLGIIDDPFKDAEEAASAALRQKRWDWYGSTFYTRESPDGPTAIVVVQTRWNQDDLAGRMLAAEDDDEPERWHIVCFDAVKDATPYPAPPTCTVEPDWREPGEPLNPARRPLAKLQKIARRIGSYWWNALFQQRPRPAEGKQFRRGWFQAVAVAPACVEYRRHWDLAATTEAEGRDPDWTAGVLIGKTTDEQFAILDVVRLRGTPLEVDRTLRATAESDRAEYGHVAITVEQEPGSSGKRTIVYLTTRVLAGFDVQGEPAGGSKPERARALAAQAEAGNLLLVAAPWNREFIDELVAFPTPGVHDDQVDAAAGAISGLCESYSAGAY